MKFYNIKMISSIYGTYDGGGIPGNNSEEAVEFCKNYSVKDDGNWQVISVEEIPADVIQSASEPEEYDLFTEAELVAQGYDYTKLEEYINNPAIELTPKLAFSMQNLYVNHGVVPMHEVEKTGGLAYVERMYGLDSIEFNEYLTSPDRLSMLNETGSRLLPGTAEFEEYLNSELRSNTLNRTNLIVKRMD